MHSLLIVYLHVIPDHERRTFPFRILRHRVSGPLATRPTMADIRNIPNQTQPNNCTFPNLTKQDIHRESKKHASFVYKGHMKNLTRILNIPKQRSLHQ